MAPKDKSSTSNQHIFVAVRCRPMNVNETAEKCWSAVECDQEKRTVAVKERPQLGAATKMFTFDKVFGTTSRQIDVYKSVVDPAIEEVIMGYNCTIFAYGQTGTGKTFTMEGERSAAHLRWEDDPMAGIIPRSLAHLFERLEAMDCEFSMRVSYLELYNEELFDLLGATDSEMRMRIYDDSSKKGSVVIQGLEEVGVTNKHEVYDILRKGSQRRQTASTVMNATSSRSHTVFTITIHTRENSVDGEELVRTGKLNLVDLAGSENIGRSGAVDKRAREAGNINQSLLTLGRVITALVDKTPHVPYRESKLTRILQDSLGGKTKTSIIATISPANSNLEETLSTLDYAHRAKNIQNKPEINQKLTKKNLIKEYNEEIERLRRDLQANRDKNGIFLNEDNYKEMQAQLASQASLLKEQQEETQTLSRELSSTVTELHNTRQTLSDACAKLSQKETELEHTRAELSKTTMERDEQMHLVECHVDAEAELQTKADLLIETVDQTKGHIEKLQTCRERQKTGEGRNFDLLSKFQNIYTQSLSTMRRNAIQFQSVQHNHCDSINNLVVKLKEADEQQLTRHCDLVKAIQHDSESQIESLLSSLSSQIDSSNECGNTVNSLISTHHNEVEKQMKKFCDQFITSLLSQWQEITCSTSQVVKELSEHASELISTVESERSQFFNELTGFVNSNKQEISSLVSLIKTSVRESSTTAQEGHQQQQKLSQEDSADIEVIKKRYEDIKKYNEDIMKHIKSVEARKEQRMKLSVSATEQISSSNIQAETFAERCDTEFRSFASSTGVALSGLATNLNNAEAKSNNQFKESEQEYDSVMQKCQTLRQSLTEANAEFTSSVQSSHEVLCRAVPESIQSCKDTLTSNQDELKSTFKAFMNQSVEGSTSFQKSLSQHSSVLLENLKLIGSASAEIAGSTTTYTTQTDVELMARDSELLDLVTNQLRPDKPSGETPSRMVYSHPQDAGHKLNHKKLISAFRTKKLNSKEELAQLLPLPSADDENHDEKSHSGVNLESGEVVANTDEASAMLVTDDESGGSISTVISQSKENIPNDDFTKRSRSAKETSTSTTSLLRQPNGRDFRKPPTSANKAKLATTQTAAANKVSAKTVKRKLPESTPTTGGKKHSSMKNME